jgi:hypothetical protein
MRGLREKVTYANVMATIAVFIALSGGAIAATQLEKNSVGNNQVKKGAVTFDKLKPGLRHRLRGRAGSTGPQGPQGVQGPQGDQGNQGIPGAPGNANTSLVTGTPVAVAATGNVNLGNVVLSDLGTSQLTVEVYIDQSQGPGSAFVACSANLAMSGTGRTRAVGLNTTVIGNPPDPNAEAALSSVQLVDAPGGPQTVTASFQCLVQFSDVGSVVLTPRVGVVALG